MANPPISRRRVIGQLGAAFAVGSVAMADSKLTSGAPAAPAPAPASSPHPASGHGGAKPISAKPKGPPPQPFLLPRLGYSYDALEPYIDARTMEIHHTKHHQAYIDAANRALAEFPAWQKKTAEELLQAGNALPEKLRIPVRNQVGGHVNHSLFWKVIGPRGGRSPRGELGVMIDKSFGSFDAFQVRFTDAAMKCFGSGWTWLSLAPDDITLVIHTTANQDSPLMQGLQPLLGLDVWEHAYYLKYQNRRLEYVEAFFRCIQWPQVEHLCNDAQKVLVT